MGLAPTQVNPYGAPAFIEQVHYYGRDERGKLIDPGWEAVFSFYMLASDVYYGKFTFGGYDMKYARAGKKESDIFWMPMRCNEYYWTVHMGKVGFTSRYGLKELQMQARMAIMDTGMSLAFIPPADFEALRTHLEEGREMRIERHPEHNLWTVDCSD